METAIDQGRWATVGTAARSGVAPVQSFVGIARDADVVGRRVGIAAEDVDKREAAHRTSRPLISKTVDGCCQYMYAYAPSDR